MERRSVATGDTQPSADLLERVGLATCRGHVARRRPTEGSQTPAPGTTKPRSPSSLVTNSDQRDRYPTTPDGRYFVVRGRLWRCSNPALPPEERARLVRELMQARRAMGAARRANDREAGQKAKAAIDQAKRGLGERGEPWWTDGAKDWNRHLVRNSPYADWFEAL